eukprot:5335455-Lingulodinium_polyedra.AAC.1
MSFASWFGAFNANAILDLTAGANEDAKTAGPVTGALRALPGLQIKRRARLVLCLIGPALD